jgi:hypothetical protein
MTVISMADARRRRAMTEGAKYDRALSGQASSPEWKDDVRLCCAYARVMKAEHAAERERITFDLLRNHDGIAWWNAPEGMQERVHENNRRWSAYIAMCAHLASLPARTRNEARVKRDTIGKAWLRPGREIKEFKPGTIGEQFAEMRGGCLADDHLFPPSLKLARLKGQVRVS